MTVRAIDAARNFVQDAATRGVMAVSPVAVARRLSCTEDQAVALLNCLETEGLVELHGYIDCPSCLEQIPLNGRSLDDLIREAHEWADKRCPICDSPLPDKYDLRVKLSFFCKAAASPAAANSSSSSDSTARIGVQYAYSLDQLDRVAVIRCENLVLAEAGSMVNVGSTVATASGSAVIAGVTSGTGSGPQAVVVGGGSALAGATVPTAPAVEHSAVAGTKWILVATAIGVVASLVAWFSLPAKWPRLGIASGCGVLIFLLICYFNPQYWHRRTVGSIIAGWLIIRGTAFGGKAFGDTLIGRFFAELNNSPAPAVFDLAAVALVAIVLWSARQQ